MRKRLLTLTFTALAMSLPSSLPTVANGQVAQPTPGATRAAQQHLIGEVTATDQTAGQITVKTDAGSSVNVMVNERTVYRRLPPGQTSLDKAEAITSVDVKVGDRVLVPGGASLMGASPAAARQVIVMAREAVAARREQQRDDWRTRGVNGRVVAIDAAKKELSIESRSREGAQTVTVVANGNARIRRYAPGSLRPADAIAGTFADIRVGDQIRVLGNRQDARVTAEEIISGTVARLVGAVERVDASRGEVVVKDSQTGKSIVIALLPTTTLRRVPADFAETLGPARQQRGGGETLTEAQRAAQREQRGEQRAARRRERENQGATAAATSPQGGQSGDTPQRPGGRTPQQMFESFPVITAAELKKGDAVMVTGTGTSDAARVMAATLITGAAEILQRLQRRGAGRPENMSPGLPSGVMGGGTGGDPDRPQPPSPPRQQ